MLEVASMPSIAKVWVRRQLCEEWTSPDTSQSVGALYM